MANDENPHQIQGIGGFGINDLRDAVGQVVGSGDDVAAAVKFVAEHGDDLVDFVKRLPDLLDSTAGALTEAGDDVASAAAFLTGGKGSGDGVSALADLAGDALDTCRQELGSAQQLLDTVADQFDKLPIPDGGIGEKIGDAAQRFDRVGDRLAEVAQQLRKLGGAVDQAGHGLARTADKLDRGGKALGAFSDR
jgi:ABC-type transporter Mla subunit MlaD